MGQRDVRQSLFELWQAVLNVDSASTGSTAIVSTDASDRLSALEAAVSAYGCTGSDYERLLFGLYENLPTAQIRDLFMKKVPFFTFVLFLLFLYYSFYCFYLFYSLL